MMKDIMVFINFQFFYFGYCGASIIERNNIDRKEMQRIKARDRSKLEGNALKVCPNASRVSEDESSNNKFRNVSVCRGRRWSYVCWGKELMLTGRRREKKRTRSC
jgi:hypothetical protein